MPRRVRTTALVALAVVLVAVAVVVGVRWWQGRDRTTFEKASAYAPADAQRLSWTDWAAVRARVGAHLDAGSSGAQVESFLNKAFDRDLSSASALVQSAPALQEHLGFSPGTVGWELFSQSQQGAVVIMSVGTEVDLGAVAGHLERAGFQKPRDAGGVWIGGDSLPPEIGSDLTPELQYVALDAKDGLILTSDQAGYLQDVVDHLGEHALPDPVHTVVSASGEPLSAVVYAGAQVCSALAMSSADPDDRATADRLLAEAGRVDPMTAYAMSAQPGGHIRVVMSFESGEQARRNAATRAKLAAGPAPGQGGDFTDRFRVVSASAHDDVVTMDLDPVAGAYVISDLSSGPVLFATC